LLALVAADGVQLIVETHSDHILNGIRLAVKKGLLASDKVALHFFARSLKTGESEVQSPALLQNGKLSNWPTGFFDQWEKSLDELLD
jgi:predicted ATPase